MDPLTPEEGRVVGCLVEKQTTVPDTYPMTLNGLRTGCNQTSSRDPIVAYDDGTVLRALESLKGRGLVRFVHASHGARTTKYRQVLDEALGLSPAEIAVVSVLLLRGPQTVGELRSRTERQHAFESIAEVEATLAALAERDQPLVRHLGREPGRREPRWAQLLTGEPNLDPPRSTPRAVERSAEPTADNDELAMLREELRQLRERFDELCRRLGEPV